MQKITLYCDSHHLFRQEEVKVDKSTIYNLGSGDKEIEICQQCDDSLSLKELRDVLDRVGRSVVKKAPKERDRSGSSKKGWGGVTKGDFTCRFCPEENHFDTLQGRGMHEFRDHPWQRLLWEQQTDYVKQKNLNGADVERRQKWLDQLSRLGISLEDAAAREQKMGAMPTVWHHSREQAAQRIMTAE